MVAALQLAVDKVGIVISVHFQQAVVVFVGHVLGGVCGLDQQVRTLDLGGVFLGHLLHQVEGCRNPQSARLKFISTYVRSIIRRY